MNQKKYYLLFIVMLVAIILRLYDLGKTPPSPDWDEAALGYNAYSILKTGRDEYGNFLPLTIRSFDDYKPPLYTYLTVPSVALFGLNTWSVRLPSVVMGVLAVVGTYLLVSELIRKVPSSKPKDQTKFKVQDPNNFDNFQFSIFNFQLLPAISALLLAISPWNLQFSRIAFEANSGITLNIWALYFFFRSFRKKWFLVPSAIIFGLTFYAYHSERVFIPLMLLGLAIIFRKEIFKTENRKYLVLSIITGFVTVAPLIPVLTDKSSLMRLRGTSSFTEKTQLLERSVRKLEYDREKGLKIGELFDNRRIEYTKTLFLGYLYHFSPKWLFLEGDNPRHHAPDMGMLYLIEMPFILYGIFLVMRSQGKIKNFLLYWLLIFPVAAAPTTGLPHSIRTMVVLPLPQIFIALGLLGFYEILKNQKIIIRFSLSLGVILLYLLNFIYYLHMYFVHMNIEYSEYWQYGYQQAIEFAEKNKDKYSKIVLSNDLEQPYIFVLFFTKYDPVRYLRDGGTKSGSFAETANGFDKYEFRSIDWPNEIKDGSILYIAPYKKIPHGYTLNYLNGQPAIEIKDRE